ncbi:hypothetical protein ABB37_04044 [Leptomonas pyrrhocoris]|uniref:MIF4G domain-containing protein n=1 Tax=Leptomonas pyrrhocoris TaxID=157538 RepID=A0A0M9G3Y5_LEPPY|nr:hypothetical protein ABB37_04044 [Leptomonas pyrrhocoris]XP_015660196.1 hypothetical protein ABB37_04044 [Leptomonas pyrrhocoris]KPA81756.1 hypothetical protein ABB37_04044 [Leptomonas pyrrhocoris]KPA81757.1 hypothetical protein ABB37_04044 [Leptomonas pyrrhocoris]|eukprot:XP_015660195.1 hypothetical protein ABB37_04044 [Leptomonas pyrrhocoris]
MLFNIRGAIQKEEKVKNQMTLADILAFRDTWKQIPEPNFSLERVLLTARMEKQRKAEIPKLVMTDNGFRIRDKKDMDESELELRRVQGSLNKLTDKNFDAVVEEMLSPDLVLNPIVLKGVVDIIFNKAMAEPVFSGIYAQLCQRINVYEQELVAEAEANPESEIGKRVAARREADMAQGKQPTSGRVRTVLILRCQMFHDNFVNQPTLSDPEAAEQLRKRNMANIKFVGELYMRSLIFHRVILAICSTALVLNFVASSKMVTTDVDLELVVNLMNVIGKKFDENASTALHNVAKDAPSSEHPHDTIWRALNSAMNDPRFSRRIRFLIQNLLEWRSEGWKPKETPAQGTSGGDGEGNEANTNSSERAQHRPAGGNAGGQGGGNMHRNPSNSNMSGGPNSSSGSSWQHQNANNNRGGGGNNNRGMPRANSMVEGGDPKFSRGGAAVAGGNRQDRVVSFNDLSQFSNSNSDYMMPPPPFNAPQPFGAPPPPFPGDGVTPSVPPQAPQSAAQMSEEDRKLMALAMPPKCIDDDLTSKVLSAIRDSAIDGDWTAAGKVIVELVPQDAAYMCRMCAAYIVVKKITETPSDDDRKLFTDSLNSGMFDVKELTRGYSWFLTNAVANNVKEDFPRAYSRFVACVAATTSMDFLSMVSNVMARTANYLDALYVPLEGAEMEWEEDFLEVWTSILETWKATHPGSQERPSELLNCIASVKQRPFMKDISSDFMMELLQQGFMAEADVQKWIAENNSNEKYRAFVAEMTQLFPES